MSFTLRAVMIRTFLHGKPRVCLAPSSRALCELTSGIAALRFSSSASSLLVRHNYKLLQPGLSKCGHARTTIPVRSLASEEQINENIKKFKEGDFGKMTNPDDFKHFKTRLPEKDERFSAAPTKLEEPPIGTSALPHPIWSSDEVMQVKVVHKRPQGFVDWSAYIIIQTIRKLFDIFSGFVIGRRNEQKWLLRIIFLETVAGVPGMVAAMVRHLDSLRRMRRDHGWIHTLLEEAENERMHLMTALQLRQPGVFFRLCVMGAQGVFVTLFSLVYMISPRFCHRMVGYLEEEAVVTYTKCIKDIEDGPLKHWKTQPAPEVAINYWHLQPNATMREVILAIRADENHHREVNHTLASMKPDDYNPYKPGQ